MTPTTLTIDPGRYTASPEPHFVLASTNAICPVVVSRVIVRIRRPRASYADWQGETFSSLAEAAFAEDWDSEADAVYDHL